ncbi:MAG TPA: glutamate--tRNA ligase [Blastocatellia bacterium]|nr:glutamate--tRNA ligase [Blastocatellia bacterium]
MSEIRVRFAPSPTGYLHVGGARTALFNWLFAKKTGGTFVLRIEDTDVERSSDEMVEGILIGMKWLGLDWDEGPIHQSNRLDIYRAKAEELINSGHAYRCFCSAEELKAKRETAAAEKRDFKYDRTCLNLSDDEAQSRLTAGQPYLVRFRVPDRQSTSFNDIVFGKIDIQNETIEDFALLRPNGHPTYHLSVVVDDIDMRITHVVRGADHISNTPKQVLLYEAFGSALPEFAHVPLILGPDKSRLSKRHGATSVMAYKDMGFVPEAFRNFLALLGWSPDPKTYGTREIFNTEELIQAFNLNGISHNNAVFNMDKAVWFNWEYIKSMPLSELIPLVRAELEKANLWKPEYENSNWFAQTVEMLRARTRMLPDFVSQGRPYFSDEFEFDPAAVEKNLKKDPALKELLPELAKRLDAVQDFNLETTEQALRAFAEERGVKAGLLINAARTALTGSAVSPGIFEVIVAIGKERTTRRLASAPLRM